MKTNIKMRVMPEQSFAVQKIVFANGGRWATGVVNIKHTDKFGLILRHCGHSELAAAEIGAFENFDIEEVDADLFIR